MNYVKLTRAEYTALTTKSNDTYYLIKNEGKMYLGSTQVWKEFLLPSQILTGIAITTPPAKTTYNVGETLDLTGIVVTATYLDGHTAVVTNSCTYVPANGTTLTTQMTAVAISYNGQTTSQSISVISNIQYVCLTAIQANTQVKITQVGTPSVTKNFAYSTDKNTWTDFSLSAAGDGPVVTLANIGDKVYFRGNNTRLGESVSIYDQFKVPSGRASLSGNINTLLDYENDITSLASYAFCFYKLFYLCTNIRESSNITLPATAVGEDCYRSMFQACYITVAPTLPATSLAARCYHSMFASSWITMIPNLPAETLYTGCYTSMFSGCMNLSDISAATMSASTLANSCCWSMFENSSITVPLALPATTLADSCYGQMFYGCANLVCVPELPATTLQNACYQSMFRSCGALIVNDVESAEAGFPWCIPQYDSATGNYTMQYMFDWCGGTRSTDEPNFNSIQKTYYTQNMPIGG